jgi:nitrate reductase gamma subunit
MLGKKTPRIPRIPGEGRAMTALLYAVTYLSALVFAAACVIRALQYAGTPLHLRWELYPMPRKEPKRFSSGAAGLGSASGRSREGRNLWLELKFMIPEIVFLKGLWEFNRRLWFFSFPFHFGLYLLILTLVSLAACGALFVFAPTFLSGFAGAALKSIYPYTGTAGLVLGMLGALGLAALRLTDPRLKIYTVPGDVFNLLLFIVTFGILSASCLAGPKPSMLELTGGLLTFDTHLKIPGLLAAGLIMASLLAAYVPMTHMSHFIAKYFTYHSVRWDDRANYRGGKLEARLAECLSYRPTWSASHVRADGTKTWAEIAALNPAREAKK